MAQVTLNRNSWHFKYYSMIVSDTPPRTLCPYFWTMVAILLISPIIGFVLLIGNITGKVSAFTEQMATKKVEKEETYEEITARWKKEDAQRIKRTLFWNKVGDVTAWIFKYIFLPLILIGLIYMGYKSMVKMGWKEFLILTGIVITFSLLIIGFITLIEKYGGRVGRFIVKVLRPCNPLNWKVTNVIGEMIKTAYTKACPLITWEGETKTANERI